LATNGQAGAQAVAAAVNSEIAASMSTFLWLLTLGYYLISSHHHGFFSGKWLILGGITK